jgi:ADP-heptose:LPS heptosyltransferase
MHRIFILRAFGDFVIFLNSICQSPQKGNYKIVASAHLLPLYDALKNEINTEGLNIEFLNFGMDKGQLRLFTNKHFISLQTLNEVRNLKAYLKNNPYTNGTDYIEQNKRVGLLNSLTSHTFQPIVFNKEVYFSYDQFFENNTDENKIAQPLNFSVNQKPQKLTNHNHNILIFPDSRLTKKDIPAIVLKEITNHCSKNNIAYKIASFKTENNQVGVADNNIRNEGESNDIGDLVNYNNFESLIQLIKSAHVVIGADSLPVHIACLLQIPHYIFNNDQLGRYFITPYAKNNKSFGTFGNYESLLKNAF